MLHENSTAAQGTGTRVSGLLLFFVIDRRSSSARSWSWSWRLRLASTPHDEHACVYTGDEPDRAPSAEQKTLIETNTLAWRNSGIACILQQWTVAVHPPVCVCVCDESTSVSVSGQLATNYTRH